MNTLRKLTYIQVCVDICMYPKFALSKRCISGRFVLRGGLCQHHEFVFVCSCRGGKLGRGPGPLLAFALVP